MIHRLLSTIASQRRVALSVILFLIGPAAAHAQIVEDDLQPLVSTEGELTLPVRLGIYVTLLVVFFLLYFLAGYRVMLKRNGMWPTTLYGLCLGLFLATALMLLWPLFGYRWISNVGGPFEAYGPQALIVISAALSLGLSIMLFRHQPSDQEAK